MAIMSDKWIKTTSIQNGMISPFVSSQIKEVDSKKIISYGVSSYGYDARVSNEFKIFTNINTTIVDPKNFGFVA
jgi:dCTP deaminase